jgi:hypothetical protein
MIEIESGVPLPVRRKSRFPFAAMKVGDSIFVPAETAADRKRVTSRAGVFKFDHAGWDYRTVVETKNGVRGVRVWRV